MNFCITNNLTKRLTNPQSSSYYATQHFQSPFLREKAVRKIGSGSRYGPYHDQRYDVAVQLQTHRFVLLSGMPKRTKPQAEASNRSASTKSWKISRPISANSISVSATVIRMLRPKKSATPSSVWATPAACCCRPSTNTLQGFLKRVGKDRAYSSYDNYRKRRNRLASFLEYEYRVKDIPFKELKRDFIEKFVVYLSSVQGMRSGTIHSTHQEAEVNDLYGI